MPASFYQAMSDVKTEDTLCVKNYDAGAMAHFVSEIAAVVAKGVQVAVDPPVTGHGASDECGILVVGAETQGSPREWRAVVLEDASVTGASPQVWAEAALDAMRRHGADRLVAVAMHSATEAGLRKLDLIDFIPDSEGKEQIRTFQGRRVVVDDSLAPRAGTTDGLVYTTYLFGPGAFAKGVAPLSAAPLQGGQGTEGVEIARAPLDSDTLLINRRRYILHPRGVKFTSASVAGNSPTNAELETAANWTRVFENKNVRIVAIDHNI